MGTGMEAAAMRGAVTTQASQKGLRGRNFWDASRGQAGSSSVGSLDQCLRRILSSLVSSGLQ